MRIAETNSLSVRYGATEALSNVSLRLGVGITGLLGPNGAGKSSLIRCLATVQTPIKGSVEIFGHSTGDRANLINARKQLGYLPQNPGFYPHFRVREFVEHFALLKLMGDRDQRRHHVNEALAAVDLVDHARVRVRQLSGGMRQRLALACALLGDPKLLILDEPTVGLDPEQRVRFREIIAKAAAERAAVLLSTHQTDDVIALCHRVLVILGGRVTFDGTPRELVGQASGRVWLSDVHQRDVIASWMTGDGKFRNVGEPPINAQLVDPTIDDGYLVLMQPSHSVNSRTA